MLIGAFNALLECIVTGLVTALAIYWMGRLGKLPFIVMLSQEEVDKMQEGFDEDE